MKRTSATIKLTLAAMSTSIGVLCLYAASVLSTMRLALLFLSSLVIWIPLNERKGFLYGLLCYIATGMLSFFIVPDKLYPMAYLAFFGLFGFLKLGLDTLISDKFAALVLRIIVCNILVGAIIFLLGHFFEIDIFTMLPELPIWLIVAVIEILLVAYELIFTMCIHAFDRNLRKHIIGKR